MMPFAVGHKISNQDSSSHLPHVHHLPRMLLVESGFFGEDPGLQKKLDSAYRHFKAYISAEKIPCSQGPFTVKMVARHVNQNRVLIFFTREICRSKTNTAHGCPNVEGLCE